MRPPKPLYPLSRYGRQRQRSEKHYAVSELDDHMFELDQDRLAAIPHADVTTTLAVTAIVFGDGETQRYSERQGP